jgi:hypothetical protein
MAAAAFYENRENRAGHAFRGHVNRNLKSRYTLDSDPLNLDRQQGRKGRTRPAIRWRLRGSAAAICDTHAVLSQAMTIVTSRTKFSIPAPLRSIW